MFFGGLGYFGDGLDRVCHLSSSRALVSPPLKYSVIVDIWRLGICLICRDYFGGFVSSYRTVLFSITSLTVINFFCLMVKNRKRKKEIAHNIPHKKIIIIII